MRGHNFTFVDPFSVLIGWCIEHDSATPRRAPQRRHPAQVGRERRQHVLTRLVRRPAPRGGVARASTQRSVTTLLFYFRTPHTHIIMLTPTNIGNLTARRAGESAQPCPQLWSLGFRISNVAPSFIWVVPNGCLSHADRVVKDLLLPASSELQLQLAHPSPASTNFVQWNQLVRCGAIEVFVRIPS